MARSLARSTKVFASTLNRTELQTVTNLTSQNTFEIKVLDGYSFSQDAATQEVGVSEAGSEAACSATGTARGTLSFNTALNPVDVSFSTYVRPTATADNTPTVGNCVERILWASAMGTSDGWDASILNDTTSLTTDADEVYTQNDGATGEKSITFGLNTSNTSELMPLTLCFVLENAAYIVEQFNVGSAEVDFSIDGIATINWSGNGSRVNEDPLIHAILKNDGTATGVLVPAVTTSQYLGVPATTTTTFLRNKLSTLELTDNEGVATTGDQSGTVTSVSGQTITTNINIVTADSYDGGRIYNTDLGQWATIVSHTTGASSTVTVSAADDITTTPWNSADVLDIFLPGSNAAIVYCIPITGATLSLENNITYLTPEELAIVNLPLAGFAGSRVTSGSFTAYLNTGTQGTGGLLADLLGKIETSVSTNFTLNFHMGNATTAYPRVDFLVPHANISIPTTNVEDIITTEISFTAKPWDTSNDVASFEDTNELTIRYAFSGQNP